MAWPFLEIVTGPTAVGKVAEVDMHVFLVPSPVDHMDHISVLRIG